MATRSTQGVSLSRRSLLAGGAGIAAATALAGCSSPSSPGGGSSAAGAGMSFMYWGSSYEDQVVRRMLGAYTDESGTPMTPLFTTGSEQEYNTKLNSLVAANNPPEVLYLHDYMSYSLAEKNLLMNMEGYLDKYPALADRLPGSYYYWDDGKLLGNQTGATANLLYYKKGAFDAAGIEYPPAEAGKAWDWDTFVSTADKLTFDVNGKHPSESGFNANDVKQFGVSNFFEEFYAFVASNGGDITDPTGMQYALDSPEAIKALQDLQDLVHTHRVAPTARQQSASGANTSTDLRSGRVAMVFDGTWAMLNLNQEKIDYGIGVHPKQAESLTVQRSGSTAIFESAADHDKAVDFYMFHNDPHNVTELFTSGLWLPLEMKYYTNEEDIAFWTDNEGHPKEFRTAVIDVILDHSVTTYTQRLKNITAIREVLLPAIDVIQQGNETAETVLTGLRDKVQPLLKGVYPAPFVK